jgi:hypothetical protein
MSDRRDLDLKTHNNYKRQATIPSAGFETAVPASDRPQTDGFDCTNAGTVRKDNWCVVN